MVEIDRNLDIDMCKNKDVMILISDIFLIVILFKKECIV